MIIESIIGGLLIMTPIDMGKDYSEQLQEVGQAKCLADNMYFEARNQGTAGIIAVSNVVLNRVASGMYPNTVCEVVRQGPHRESWRKDGTFHPVRHKCQFSWYCDGKSDRIYDLETFDNILMLAEAIVLGQIQVLDITEGATHYHADYVEPAWAKTKTKTIEIEDHIFYRWEIQE